MPISHCAHLKAPLPEKTPLQRLPTPEVDAAAWPGAAGSKVNKSPASSMCVVVLKTPPSSIKNQTGPNRNGPIVGKVLELLDTQV